MKRGLEQTVFNVIMEVTQMEISVEVEVNTNVTMFAENIMVR